MSSLPVLPCEDSTATRAEPQRGFGKASCSWAFSRRRVSEVMSLGRTHELKLDRRYHQHFGTFYFTLLAFEICLFFFSAVMAFYLVASCVANRLDTTICPGLPQHQK